MPIECYQHLMGKLQRIRESFKQAYLSYRIIIILSIISTVLLKIVNNLIWQNGTQILGKTLNNNFYSIELYIIE